MGRGSGRLVALENLRQTERDLLYELRDYSESLREKMAEKTSRAEASVKASEVVKDLFKGADFQEYLEELMREEREKDQWLQRGGAGAAPY